VAFLASPFKRLRAPFFDMQKTLQAHTIRYEWRSQYPRVTDPCRRFVSDTGQQAERRQSPDTSSGQKTTSAILRHPQPVPAHPAYSFSSLVAGVTLYTLYL
jgi:hypothetical protein